MPSHQRGAPREPARPAARPAARQRPHCAANSPANVAMSRYVSAGAPGGMRTGLYTPANLDDLCAFLRSLKPRNRSFRRPGQQPAGARRRPARHGDPPARRPAQPRHATAPPERLGGQDSGNRVRRDLCRVRGGQPEGGALRRQPRSGGRRIPGRHSRHGGRGAGHERRLLRPRHLGIRLPGADHRPPGPGQPARHPRISRWLPPRRGRAERARNGSWRPGSCCPRGDGARRGKRSSGCWKSASPANR
jgi:hypothetical protein